MRSLNIDLAVDHIVSYFVLHNFMILNGEVLMVSIATFSMYLCLFFRVYVWCPVPSFIFQDWNDMEPVDEEEEEVDDPDDPDDVQNEADVPLNVQRALEQARLRGTEKRLEIVFGLH